MLLRDIYFRKCWMNSKSILCSDDFVLKGKKKRKTKKMKRTETFWNLSTISRSRTWKFFKNKEQCRQWCKIHNHPLKKIDNVFFSSCSCYFFRCIRASTAIIQFLHVFLVMFGDNLCLFEIKRIKIFWLRSIF